LLDPYSPVGTSRTTLIPALPFPAPAPLPPLSGPAHHQLPTPSATGTYISFQESRQGSGLCPPPQLAPLAPHARPAPEQFLGVDTHPGRTVPAPFPSVSDVGSGMPAPLDLSGVVGHAAEPASVLAQPVPSFSPAFGGSVVPPDALAIAGESVASSDEAN
jgi:hypothetical protein